MNISIVIRCLNEERHIGRLLHGIVQQIGPAAEIVVVDSGSTDNTLEIVSQYPVTLVEIRPEEFSFGRSLNIGCEASTGDIIVIASAHVYPLHTDWFQKMTDPFADPQVALVYGQQVDDETTEYSERRILKERFPDESNLDQSDPYCNNANSAIRRSVWESLRYDENLTGLEDMDWGKRALQLGHRIVYIGDAQVIHIHNESLKQTYNRYRREAIAFKKIFPEQNFSLWDFVRLAFTNTVNDYQNALSDHVLLKNILSIPEFRLTQFWGTFKGFGQMGPVSDDLKRTFYYPKRNKPLNTDNPNIGMQQRVKYMDNP